MTIELLKKFLNNYCTSEELDEIIHWVSKDSFNKESISLGFQAWESFRASENEETKEKFSTLLDKIHHKINITKYPQIVNHFERIRLPIFITWLTRIAAILLLPVLSLWFFTIYDNLFYSSKNDCLSIDSLEIISPIGSRTMVQLSDGSEVYLNFGSKIKYPQIFSGDNREVILSGEGYFNVVHNPEKPFVVKTGKLSIKALGTAFNVLAYPEDNFIETTLVEGKLVVEKTEPGGKVITIAEMEPGKHLDYNIKTSAVFNTKEDIKKYIAWKDGKMIFENEPIIQVTERLSRMFNADIEITGNIKDYTYTVTFVDETLFQILDLMTLATPVSYKTLPRKKLPDGTFSKQKILIYNSQ